MSKTLHKRPEYTPTIRFKMRKKGDWRPWEELDGLDLPIIGFDTAWAVARDFLCATDEVAEVRWSTIGSLQGHYLSCTDPDITLVEGR